MTPDLPLALAAATVVGGGLWAHGRLGAAARARRARGEPAPGWVAGSGVVFAVLVAALLLRAFVAEPFRIPSASMRPTLEPGDFILVDKHAFGLRLPWSDVPVGGGPGPRRGDVVVFRWPPDPSQDYIKRVIGLPGDVVEYADKALTVNGERVPLELGPPRPSGEDLGAREGAETLSSGPHAVLVRPWQPEPAGRWEVPAGHYFVMGDNRDNSRDSRDWGFVPTTHLVGRATLVWMSWPPLPAPPRWDRIGLRIH